MERKKHSGRGFCLIPGDLRQNDSAQVSARFPGFLEPGTELLEPFGQKECRSPGAGSRTIFFLEIGPRKFPGSSLPSITSNLPPDLKKETKLEDGYHLPNCGKIVPQDEVKIIQDSTSNSPSPPSIIHEAEAPAHPVITPASIIHKETPASIIIKEHPAPPVINTDIEKYDFGTGRPLDPPPSSCFTSMDDLVCFCQLWAKSHGYAVFKSNSHLGKNVYIKCNRSGHFQGAVLNQSGRKTATLKINCPFQIKGSIATSKKITSKFWTLEILNGTHNHKPSDGAASHSAHKRLIPKQFEEIRKLSQANLKPAQILLQLQTSDNKTYAKNKTISNALQKLRREDLEGRKPIEALLDILKESNWLYDVKVNSNGAVLNLFFAHPGLVHPARINHHVALLDST
ncbi:hypothetical protein PCASD_06514 [Puccinia coronata f. sp. avenae]|uniref:FAR1 domain-containing protein n=1 Tax=Puccinia coronata f. sp. avenae TaxID=200324 RepID=A0A2N5V230_9BASI|nr:hypothetical protein PCASD_06514 [Puccinia coronata f. sp. avenae]